MNKSEIVAALSRAGHIFKKTPYGWTLKQPELNGQEVRSENLF